MSLNKKTIIMVSIISLFVFILAGCSQTSNGGEGEKIVIKVNGEEMPMDEFNNYLETFIEKRVVLEDSNKKNIKADDEEIKQALSMYEQQYGGEENFKNVLEQNEVSIDEFKEELEYVSIHQKHAEDFMENVEIPDEEAKKYFEENKDEFISVRASHILLETEEKGKEILKKLDEGEDFKTLATEESTDESSAQNGGDLNYFKKGKMVKEFEDVAFKLKPGEVSDLVKSQHGYHIIKVEDRMEEYNDLKDEVLQVLKDARYEEYIEGLKEKAKVEIYLEDDKKDNKENK
ncbi:MAG TPA: peptidylprolyl isomerase [Tissierellales bacterium]|nr:peptidylprolyl isomerase [Tissierellales bacterium]